MPPRGFRAQTMLAKTDALESWLRDLGFNKNTRVHQAIDLFRATTKQLTFDGPVSSDKYLGEDSFLFRDFLCAQSDVAEFTDIHAAFGQEEPERIVPKLERALSGPFSAINETNENSDARNVQFELSLAAEWRLNGLSVDIGEPDFTLHLGTTNFLIECKRPSSEGSVRRNIRQAKNQLERTL
jgi:hypothetical protein